MKNFSLNIVTVFLLLVSTFGTFQAKASDFFPEDPLSWGWSYFAPPREGDMRAWEAPKEPKDFTQLVYVDEWTTKNFLSSREGEFTLLNFWATWCAPCVDELPSLDRLQRMLDGRNIDVLAFSLNEGQADQVGNFYAEHGIENLDVAVEHRNSSSFVDMAGLPTTVLLDPYGNEVGRFEGPTEWDSKESLAVIDYYLEMWDSLAADRIALCEKERAEPSYGEPSIIPCL